MITAPAKVVARPFTWEPRHGPTRLKYSGDSQARAGSGEQLSKLQEKLGRISPIPATMHDRLLGGEEN
jgi:hypothetical protein